MRHVAGQQAEVAKTTKNKGVKNKPIWLFGCDLGTISIVENYGDFRMTKKNSAAKKTLVTLLLDRSGSMQNVKDDTIGAINAYLATLRASGEDIRFSLVMFDANFSGGMDLSRICVAKKISKVADLTSDDFQPRGQTPLIDASCATIQAVAESLGDRTDTNVVFAIQTDGAENASVEFTWEGLRSLIAEKEVLGWEFNFMGCGIDAYEQGARMGISRDKTLSYGKDRIATRAAFEATASNTALYASGTTASVGYTSEQKKSAGDLS